MLPLHANVDFVYIFTVLNKRNKLVLNEAGTCELRQEKISTLIYRAARDSDVYLGNQNMRLLSKKLRVEREWGAKGRMNIRVTKRKQAEVMLVTGTHEWWLRGRKRERAKKMNGWIDGG